MDKTTPKIVMMKTADLIPYENNPRKNDDAVKYVANSIREFGFKVPIVIDKENVIVAGHTRLKAAESLGIEEVPCIVANDLTEAQIKAFRLADNKTAEVAEWDFDALNMELEDLWQEFDMTEFGFDLESVGNIDDFDDDEKTDDKYFADEEIQSKIVENWKTYDSLDEYIETIIDEPTAMYQYNRLCQGYDEGYNISLLFNPHRLDTETIKNKSIFYGFNNDTKYREQFARYMVKVQNKCVVPDQYYKFIAIGTAGYQYVNEFPPYVARDIYKRFCKDGDKILNPCAGWGGRLLGLSSLQFEDIEYVEIEPSVKTFEGLQKIKKWLGLGNNYKQICDGFETAELPDEYFDFVFTSPPYFNTEKYSDDEKQSYLNKNDYEQWKNEFYYVLIDKIVRVMKKGATCILNVGNVRYPLESDLVERLKKEHNIKANKIDDYNIGGVGIGNRTGDGGEPFVIFQK